VCTLSGNKTAISTYRRYWTVTDGMLVLVTIGAVCGMFWHKVLQDVRPVCRMKCINMDLAAEF
jgi:hypothetical protein